MISFLHPNILWLLLAIPVAGVIYLMYLKWRNVKLKKLASQNVRMQISSGVSTRQMTLKFLLQVSVFALLVLAVARPQVSASATRKVISAGDVVICLDVSNSMLAEDIRPNRLTRARQAIATLIRQLDHEQIGLVVFAGEAYIQIPLTTDRNAALMLLSTITAGDISNQGTAIADAIALAGRTFTNSENSKGGKTIILVSDGEDHEGNVIEEAKSAAAMGITIYTLGIGDPNGTPIPVYQKGDLTGYKKDRQGNTILSTLNPTLLADIAAASGGSFFLSDNLSDAMQRIKQMVRNQVSGERITVRKDDADEQYQWFAGAALLLLAIERLIPNRRNKQPLPEMIIAKMNTISKTQSSTDV